ncbi:MAG: iron-containing redox enzyme family protein [Actinomycetota bacterium]
MAGDDFQLALYLCYELHYRGFRDVDERWEWEPSLIAFRRSLEDGFEQALTSQVVIDAGVEDVALALREIAKADDDGPSLADHLQSVATLDQFREFLIHRSAYQLKEADPHSWALPRLSGKPKAALMEIQADEYGSGSAERMHAHLFANAMAAVDLDPTYGAYVEVIPGPTLATVNLMSMFGLNRRWRGAIVGHLALFEMTSSGPNRKYANGLCRLGAPAATEFFDEHVEADAVHEVIAVHDLAGSLALDEPELAHDILFGAQALAALDARFARSLLGPWKLGQSSLLPAPPASVG